jgi:tetratricopeptide (TPR) repeat protein
MQVATKYASEGLEKQRAGKIDEAIELYRKSLASNDKISGVWTNLGLAMRDKQNFVDAAKAFQRAADLSPQDPRPLAYLGVLYLERNWNREALDNFEAALNRDSMNQDALRGAVQASQRLGKRDERTLEIVKKLLLVENDPKWRTEMELRKVGLEQHLAELARETKK